MSLIPCLISSRLRMLSRDYAGATRATPFHRRDASQKSQTRLRSGIFSAACLCDAQPYPLSSQALANRLCSWSREPNQHRPEQESPLCVGALLPMPDWVWRYFSFFF